MTTIKLHREHGLNPTIPICFWCGKERNEAALLGAAYKGEAPMQMVLDYKPCDQCAEKMALGIAFMEASDTPLKKGQQSINPDNVAYPTGRFIVASENFARRLLPDPVLSQVLEQRRALVDTQTFEMLFKDVLPLPQAEGPANG